MSHSTFRFSESNISSDTVFQTTSPTSSSRQESANYAECLQEIKTTFDKSEKELVAELIAKYYCSDSSTSIQLLDIGTGNGEFLEKVILLTNELRKLHFSITGLDPSGIDKQDFSDRFSKISASKPIYRECSFEDFVEGEPYNLLNATHSLYYVNDIRSCLQKMANITAPNGLIIITLWSQKCGLYKIHQEFRRAAYESKYNDTETVQSGIKVYLRKLCAFFTKICIPIAAFLTEIKLTRRLFARLGFVPNKNLDQFGITCESVLTLAAELDTLRPICLEYFEGNVKIKEWKKSPTALRSAMTILSRMSNQSSLSSGLEKKFRDIVNARDDLIKRVNGVIVIQKS